MKVSCNIIMRDVSDRIIDCLDSTEGYFDEYVFCDTGSTDNSKKLVQKWCKKHKRKVKIIDYCDYKFSKSDKRERKNWGDIPQVYWDFGDARQIALANVSKDMDWMFWIDTDDIMAGVDQIDTAIEGAMIYDAYMITLPYHYAQDQYGNDLVLHYRERFIRLKDKDGKQINVEWRDPVHEYVYHDRFVDGTVDKKAAVVVNQDVRLYHKRKIEHVKDTNRRNNRILYYQLEQSLKDPDTRLLSNLAYDHFEHHEWEESIRYYEQLFEKLGDKEHPYVHLYNCLHKYAKCCIEMGEVDKAHKAIEQMIQMDPDNPDAYLEKAELYLRTGNDILCESYINIARGKKEPQTMLPTNSLDYRVKPLLMLAQIYSKRGEIEQSIRLVSEALNYVPGEKTIQKQRRDLIGNLPTKGAFEGILALREELLNTGEIDKLVHLVGVMPESILSRELIQNIIKNSKDEYEQYKRRMAIKLSDKKNIAFYVGQGYEKWTPETVKGSGIGGSETMVIELARELVKLGNEVTVYNHCGTLQGDYDGVKYVDYRKYKPEIEHDIMIVERIPMMFRYKMNAKRQYLHLHDTFYGELPRKYFMLPDRIFIMSDAHQHVLQEAYDIPDDKFWITRNAIDVDLDKVKSGTLERDPYALFYGSSYDRGIDFVLECYTEIKKKIPELKINICYGWETYDKRMKMLLEQNNPEGKMMRDHMKKVKALMKQDGVIHHGRVDKETLAKLQYESSIWAYFTEFYEISCITAMVCQAAGTIPICSDYAALSETVQYGWKLPMPRNKEEYIKTTIDALKDQKQLEKIRKQMIPWAREAYSIESLAKEWNKFFEEN